MKTREIKTIEVLVYACCPNDIGGTGRLLNKILEETMPDLKVEITDEEWYSSFVTKAKEHSSYDLLVIDRYSCNGEPELDHCFVTPRTIETLVSDIGYKPHILMNNSSDSDMQGYESLIEQGVVVGNVPDVFKYFLIKRIIERFVPKEEQKKVKAKAVELLKEKQQRTLDDERETKFYSEALAEVISEYDTE